MEVFQLIQYAKTLTQAAQLSGQPALNVPSEMRGNVRLLPNGYNYYDDPQRTISGINSGINYPVGIDQLERLQKSIEDKYRVEFFLTLARSTREMTAAEIYERQGEKASLMGPQVDRLITEGLSKIFDIVSDIADKAGRLPPPPDMVRQFDTKIKIRFTGPLAQAQQRLFKIQPIRNALNELFPIAQVKPEVLDRVDWDEVSEEILEAGNFPQKLILSDDRLAKLRQAKAEAAQKQEQMMQMQGAAEAFPKMSKVPQEGSPAKNLMKSLGGK